MSILGRFSRHLMQFADDGSFGRGRPFSWGKVTIDDLQIGESYEDKVIIDGWRHVSGRKVRMEHLQVDGSMLVSRTPLEEWKPTSFDYEGYTGNAGNTLERWYHKSAIVVWPRSHHYEMLVKTGLRSSIDAFLKLLDETLDATKESVRERRRDNCVAFATAIIDGWPQRMPGHHAGGREEAPGLEQFAKALPKLEDRGIVERFLLKAAVSDWCLSLDRVIIDGCKRHGVDEMFGIIQRYLMAEPQPKQYRPRPASGLSLRDAAWLLKIATSRNRAGLTESQLSELHPLVGARLANEVSRALDERYPQPPHELGLTLVTLMKAAIAMEDDAAFERCLALRRGAEAFLDQRVFDVRVCTDLAVWSDKRSPNRLSALRCWIDETRGFLEASTAAAPVPPDDFRRPSAIGCDCGCCAELREFLMDADSETGEIRALKARLEHVQKQIRRDQLDVVAKLDRSTRPFALRLQKTLKTHERAMKQYQADLKSLARLCGCSRSDTDSV